MVISTVNVDKPRKKRQKSQAKTKNHQPPIDFKIVFFFEG